MNRNSCCRRPIACSSSYIATTSLWQTLPRGLFQYEITGAPSSLLSCVSRRWVLSNRIGGCLIRRRLALASTACQLSGSSPTASRRLGRREGLLCVLCVLCGDRCFELSSLR